MELLRSLAPRQRVLACALLAAGAAGGAGCFLLRSGERPFAFSHALHVGQEALECINCHETVAVGDAPGLPGPDGCLVCHGEIDAEKAAERRVEGLFEAGEFRAQRASLLDDELVFSHLLHVEAGLECSACHHGIEASQAVGPELAPTMLDCTECHGRMGQREECSTCHTRVDAGTLPATHDHDWTRRHGRVYRAGQPGTVNRCSLCHAESSCAKCHATEPPSSHDANWRLRGHGIFSRIDRESCATCHEPTACDRCHADTLPRSHTPSFGGTRSSHCLVCHQPLSSSDCATCHRATPSHLATPKPSWHTPAMNCRGCHGLGQSLPHVDNGDDCNICHR